MIVTLDGMLSRYVVRGAAAARRGLIPMPRQTILNRAFRRHSATVSTC
jgi:hypothetical protein